MTADHSSGGRGEDARSAAGRGKRFGRPLLAALFATVLVQIAAMALISRFDAHPDERSHVAVGDYYVHWWLPPAAGDPRIVPSLSNYGSSYHYQPSIAYFLAGKAVAPVQGLLQHRFRAFRFFNAGLLAILAGVALWRRDDTFGLLLLLLPAQVWYLFSYFNDDALALFACLLCCWQIARPEAAFARFLHAEDWKTGWGGALLFGLLLAILLLSKRNYHIFLVFLAGHAACIIGLSGDWIRRRRPAIKSGIVVLMAFSFVWPNQAFHEWVNDPARAANRGSTRHERIQQQAERYAAPGFKPSELGTESGFGMTRMRDRGVPFGELFTRHRWHELTIMSFFGLYGYMDLASPPAFYAGILLFYLSFLATLCIRVLRRGSMLDRAYFLAGLAFCGGLVAASAYHSWTIDFQAQGRYLFPAFGALFLTVLKLEAIIPGRILWRHGLAVWLLSSYSFIFTGLRWILK